MCILGTVGGTRWVVAFKSMGGGGGKVGEAEGEGQYGGVVGVLEEPSCCSRIWVGLGLFSVGILIGRVEVEIGGI